MLKPKGRIVSLDLLRVIAIFCVVGIHTSQLFIYVQNTASIGFILGNILNCISRIGVPLFVMLSGALMLNENKALSFKTTMNKVLKILILLFSWSIIYALLLIIIKPLCQGISPSFTDFAHAALTGDYYLNGATHFWYLYMIIGLYLITPILRAFVCIANAKIVLWFIVLAFATVFIPRFLDGVLGVSGINDSDVMARMGQFRISLVGEYGAYYLLGWYLFYVNPPKKFRIIVYIIGVLSLMFLIVATQCTYDGKGTFIFYDNLKLPAICYAMAVFLFIKNCKYLRENRFITLLSKLSFGVYAAHFLLLELALTLFGSISVIPIKIVVYFVFISAASFIVSYVLSLIPFVRKIVRC